MEKEEKPGKINEKRPSIFPLLKFQYIKLINRISLCKEWMYKTAKNNIKSK